MSVGGILVGILILAWILKWPYYAWRGLCFQRECVHCNSRVQEKINGTYHCQNCHSGHHTWVRKRSLREALGHTRQFIQEVKSS